MKRILEVQKEIGILGKDSKNPFFKSAYLDLNKLLINITPLLHKHGLILVQPISDGKVSSAILDAENGKTLLRSELVLPDLKDPQKLGSAITYFRRYTLKSLLAIAEGDDDANLASAPEQPTKESITALINQAKAASDLSVIRDWIKHFDLADIANAKLDTFKND